MEEEGADVLRIMIRTLLENDTVLSSEAYWQIFETLGEYANVESASIDTAMSIGATLFLHISRTGPTQSVRSTSLALLAAAARREFGRSQLEQQAGWLTKKIFAELEKNSSSLEGENAASILYQVLVFFLFFLPLE